MALKNIDFEKVSEVSPAQHGSHSSSPAAANKDQAYVEDSVAGEYSSARAIGVRKAPGASAVQKADSVVPVRRQPVSLTVAANGDVDYKDLDRPAYQRRAAQSGSPVSIGSALMSEPIHALPNINSRDGARINMSDTLSDFIRKMRTVPNEKLGCVDFSMPDESKVAFRRFPDAITVGDRTPDDSIILAMLELGKSDFGAIEVYGAPEFIAAAVRVAIANGIVLQNREYSQALSAPRARMKG